MAGGATFIIEARHAGLRLDRVVADALSVSRRQAVEWIAEGRVAVNGRAGRKGQTVEEGSHVEVRGDVSPVEGAALPDDSVPVSVLYEDDRLVAVDKPAGIHCHPLSASERGTVANFLAARFPETAVVGFSPLQPGLVNRIDSDTSGIVLAARDADAFAALRAQFDAHSVHKTYLALVEGHPPRAGRIALPIAKLGRRDERVRVLEPGDAKRVRDVRPAETRFRLKEELSGCALVRIEPVTGLMHQIRAHMAHIGYPVIGDRIYGFADEDVPRQMLHAWKLVLSHPSTGERVRLVCPLPEDFRRELERRR